MSFPFGTNTASAIAIVDLPSGSKRTASAMSSEPIQRRVRSMGSGRGRLEPAEAPLPAGEVAEGGVEHVGREVRPADRRHPQLGVRDLPEQVVAHAHLSRGPN